MHRKAPIEHIQLGPLSAIGGGTVGGFSRFDGLFWKEDLAVEVRY